MVADPTKAKAAPLGKRFDARPRRGVWPIETRVPYQLRRSARARRLRISVGPAGVEVVAPLRMRAADIAAFVEHNRAWIDARLEALQRVQAAHPGSAQLIDGGTILYRGQPVRCACARAQAAGAGGQRSRGHPPRRLDGRRSEAAVERLLRRWLAWAAQNDALAYVQRHGRPHGLVPAAVRVKEHKHLWGSCSAKGMVNLNWRLIFAPARGVRVRGRA